MSTVYLIAGRSACGKNVLGNYFVKYKNCIEISFAESLKEIVSKKYNIPLIDTQTQEGKKKLVKIDGGCFTVRNLLINTAKNMRFTNDTVFANIVFEKIKNIKSDIVITDFRYPIEHSFLQDKLHRYTIKTIKVIRDKCNYIDDPSETMLEQFKFDYIIHNNDQTIDEFYDRLINLYKI
jgi:glycerol-3-phosphate cytidylyltransferase-like family protein